MSMCELGQQPHDAACRAGICEVQLSGLLGGWARRQVPHWEFLEEIFCCAVEKSIHTDKCPDYLHNSSSSFPLCLLSWGSKVFHLAESKRATLPFVSHRNSTELCTQYHHSFSFFFFLFHFSVFSCEHKQTISAIFILVLEATWLMIVHSWLLDFSAKSVF